MKRVGVAIAVAALVAAGGCDAGPKAPAVPQPPLGSGTKVTATLTDFHIALSQQTFDAGTYTFEVTNAGQATHSLEIVRDGEADVRSDNIRPGHSDKITIAMTKGTYQVYCPVGNHRSQGMDMKLTVS
jgi:uncharacterized cupredoxin-like copper-binding protein